MDLDTTIKGIPLTRKNLEKIINEIITININDNINFKLENIKDIRLEDEYSGYNVNLKAEFDGLKTNLMIDVTTGDVITYSETEYQYKTIFDNEAINIMTYNFETIIAEKLESILSRNIENTRMKDYYDLYMFVNFKWDVVNKKELVEAIKRTSIKRKTEDYILNAYKYIELIEDDNKLKHLWKSYALVYSYANDINFEDTIKAIKAVCKVLELVEV